MIFMRFHLVSSHVILSTRRSTIRLSQHHSFTSSQQRLLGSRHHLVSEGRSTAQSPTTTQTQPSLPVTPTQQSEVASTQQASPATTASRRSPFYFETGYSIFAKRPTRPFPPPFISPPSGSFSDPLTTHTRVSYRNPTVDGELLAGITNGDDAIITSENFLAVNDGVGAWAQKERGHAALWSRLIAHYWAKETQNALKDITELQAVDAVRYLETAFEKTKSATNFGEENQIMGTTTASGAVLHHKIVRQRNMKDEQVPVVAAVSLGDCAVLVVRPGLGAAEGELVFKSKEDWHWFDCPRQLGTNSPDTPKNNAFVETVDVKEGDVVVVVSDGVTDNLYEEEIVECVDECVRKWDDREKEAEDGVVFVARTIMEKAREVALDPYAGSPYMERAVDEGLAAEGGKLDDISVVVGVVRRDKKWKGT